MMCLLFLFLIGLFLINSKGALNKTSKSSALEILNEKYAKGEISDEEYEKKKKLLS